MKKIFTFLLVLSIAAAAFAEFRWVTEMDFNTNLYGIIIPTGEYADSLRTNPMTGDKQPNNSGAPAGLGLFPTSSFLFPGAPYGSYVPISQGAFVSQFIAGNVWQWSKYNGLKLAMIWNGDNVNAYLASFLNGLVQTNADGFMNSREITLQQLLGFALAEYWIRANTDLFNIYIGNQGNLGRTEGLIFQDFTDWSLYGKVDGFGVNLPHPEANRNLLSIEGNNFCFAVNRDNWNFSRVTYLLGTVKLDKIFPNLPFPLYTEFGFDLGRALVNTPDSGIGQTRFGGGIRISGQNVANLFSFDVTYRLRGGDPTNKNNWDETENPSGDLQPDGAGMITHIAGAYIGFPSVIPDLGISAGYTALFRTFEDQKIGRHNETDEDKWRTIRRKGPFFNGIDLRMRYSGIQDLRLTFNNNVSFAAAREPVYDDDDNILIRRIGMDALPISQYRSQSWLALQNSLAARLFVTSRFSMFLEVASQLSILTENNSDEDRTGTVSLGGLDSWGTRVKTKHTMISTLYASHQFNSLILLQAGLSVYLENSAAALSGFPDGEPGQHAAASYSAGGLGLSLPVRVRFLW